MPGKGGGKRGDSLFNRQFVNSHGGKSYRRAAIYMQFGGIGSAAFLVIVRSDGLHEAWMYTVESGDNGTT
jgi:hypothetical protein